ncbi:acetate/propionate family kinase [Thiolapillus sp.]
MAILTLNAGSSSLKFSLYDNNPGQQQGCLLRGSFTCLGGTSSLFSAVDGHGKQLEERRIPTTTHAQSMEYLLDWLPEARPGISIDAAGHRIVHGGSSFIAAVLLTSATLQQLYRLIPLAPLHLPHNLAVIEILQAQQPHLPQVACFDTAFHHNMPIFEQMYALPRRWFAKGIRRYGFHGLSYEYIASILPDHLGSVANARVIVAHLGNGASLCAMHRRQSVATTMGFTPLDGIPMATRPGSLDPGIITYLMREEKLLAADIDMMLNHECGLAGLSGGSGDMLELMTDSRAEAAESIAYFVHHTHRAIASLAAALGGLDALVFTAGIGEKCSTVRRSICIAAEWMGIRIDLQANSQNKTRISLADSKVSVWVLPTNEEKIIARHVHSIIKNDKKLGTPAITNSKEIHP